MEIRYKRLTTSATTPTKAHKDDAGWDLYADEDVTILPGQLVKISTGVAFAIPNGYVGLIWDRSGFSTKNAAHRFAGVIDSGYHGNVLVAIYNTVGVYYSMHNNKVIDINLTPVMDVYPAKTIEVKRGDKIAQILFQKHYGDKLVEVDELDETNRGDKGFGSSDNV